MKFNIFKGSKVGITAINLRWRGAVHNMGKMEVKSKEFEVSIPFHNKPQRDYTLSYIKTQTVPPVVITGIEVKEPFKLVSVEPQTPVVIKEDEKAVFKLKLAAPDMGYEGPLNVELKSDATDLAHIEITKVMVTRGGKEAELPIKPMILDLPKGQVFRQTIHLLGFAEFGTEIKKVSVNKPFLFVSSDPAAPFKIDKKTGFMVDVYLESPKSNYGGPLEIEIS